MEQRRALLRARRKNKQSQEVEDQRIKDKVDMIEEEQQERQAISEDYLRKMFKRSGDADGEETKAEKQKRLDLLNEYLQDQFLERLSGLLTKQFTEKEQMIKALLSKYMEARLAETAAIKANFKIDQDKLDQLKETGDLDDASYQENKKNLIMAEAEMMRTLDLTMEKGQKDEDATLRSELEKKHLTEQVEFRKAMAEQQAQLRRQLIGDAKMVGDDTAQDQKALEKYEA